MRIVPECRGCKGAEFVGFNGQETGHAIDPSFVIARTVSTEGS